MEPTFFEDNVVWKLQVRNVLPVFGSVFLFGAVWHTTILRHFQKLALFASGGHCYLPGPTSLVFKLIAPSLFSFCIGCIPYLEAGETVLLNMWVVPFAIAVFGQKCLEATSSLKYEPLNSCITVHSVWMMRIFNAMVLNTCGRKKDEKHVKNQDGCLKVPLFDNAMPCSIDGKISLVLKHQYIVPSTLLALATNIRTHKATKIHTLTPLTYELFF